MAPLPNRRREAFALELAKGKSASEAMRAAGYADPRNSTRLTKNDEIADRVAELRGRASEKTELTLERLLEEAEAARVLAMANGRQAQQSQPSEKRASYPACASKGANRPTRRRSHR